MRSRASYKGHPTHPALVPFPFAFLYGAFLFDAAGRLLDRPELWRTGGHLAIAGIVAAVIAAIPGIIDFRYTVPPRSSGSRRATRHALVNLSAVALFVIAVLLRGAADTPPGASQLVMTGLGAALLTAGGWMGGVLVNRNQIGVDPRYARAGKWSEVTISGHAGAEVVVARSDELELDQMKLVRLADRRIVLARTEDGYVAFDDACTHRGGSLAGGAMICGTVQCPWHGSQFDVRSGAVRAGPAERPVATYSVAARDGQVFLQVPRS